MPTWILVDGFWTLNGYRTCLIYDIDKGLCVVHKEATDRVTVIFTQGNLIDQSGEFIGGECTSNQTRAGCDVEFEKDRSGEQSVFRTRSVTVVLKTYRSRK